METIGEFLGRVRDLAGMTQAEVARLRQTSRGTLSQLEMKIANPRWSSIEGYAEAIRARVTIRFDLFNGHSAELVAGQIAPDLLSDLLAEREQQRKDPRFGSAIAGRIAEAVEPGRWARQNSLRILLWAAVAANPRTQALFEDEMDFGHWEDDSGNWTVGGETYVAHPVSVTDRNRVTFRNLAGVVAWIAGDIGEAGRVFRPITPLAAFAAYVDEGAPGASTVAEHLSAIAADSARTDRVLAAIGYLPPDPQAIAEPDGAISKNGERT